MPPLAPEGEQNEQAESHVPVEDNRDTVAEKWVLRVMESAQEAMALPRAVSRIVQRLPKDGIDVSDAKVGKPSDSDLLHGLKCIISPVV